MDEWIGAGMQRFQKKAGARMSEMAKKARHHRFGFSQPRAAQKHVQQDT